MTADLAFTDAPLAVPVSFTPGTFTNAPEGTRGARRAMLDLMVKAVDNAPAGAAIHLTTAKLGDKPLYRALRAAIERKVHVQVVTRRNHPTQQELNLMNVLGDKVWKKDWAVGCDDECRAIESRGKLPQTRLLVSQSGISEAVRIDADAPMVFSSGKTSPRRGSGPARRRTTARSSGSSCWSAGRSERAQSELARTGVKRQVEERRPIRERASGWVARLETR